MKNQKKNLLIVLMSVLFIYGLFLFISRCTPLCGDDWAFYNQARGSGAINAAISMFNTWEARLFTLINIHAIITNKTLWTMLNPLFYVIVFICTLKIIKPKNYLSTSVLFLFMMLYIKDEVRMETYSWITGSIYYVLPMVVAFIGIAILVGYFDKDYKPNGLLYILMVMTMFYVPLGMENIAGTLLFALLFLILYRFIVYKEWNKQLIIALIFMVISFAVWSISPGTKIRTESLGTDKISLIEQIIINLPRVINYTFIDNKYLIAVLSVLMTLYNFFNSKTDKKIQVFFAVVYGIAVIDLLSENINNILGNPVLLFMSTKGSVFNNFFWLIFTATYLVNIIMLYIEDNSNLMIMFMGLLGACAAAVLFISPVIGSRLEIYTIYFLTASLMAVTDRLINNKYVICGFSIVLMLLCFVRTRTLLYKYQSVKAIQEERETEIYYYHIYHEKEDTYVDGKLWLPRFGIYTVHGGDIEEYDDYHMEAFKTYYEIAEDVVPTFYFKDEY